MHGGSSMQTWPLPHCHPRRMTPFTVWNNNACTLFTLSAPLICTAGLWTARPSWSSPRLQMWGVMQKLTWGTVAAVAAQGLTVHAAVVVPIIDSWNAPTVPADDFTCGRYHAGVVYSGEDSLGSVDVSSWDDCVLTCFSIEGCQLASGDTTNEDCNLFGPPSNGDPVATYQEGSWAYRICEEELSDDTCDLGFEMASNGECAALRIGSTGSDGNWGEVHHVLPESVNTQAPYSSRVRVSGCQGTLVNWNTVLTAAHCVDVTDEEEVPVYPADFGGEAPFGTYTFVPATNAFVPDLYYTTTNGKAKFDIAIIILDVDVASDDDTLEIGPASIRASSLGDVRSPVWMVRALTSPTIELAELGPGSITVVSESVTEGEFPGFSMYTREGIESWGGWSGAAVFDDDFSVLGITATGGTDVCFDCAVTQWVIDVLNAHPPADHPPAQRDDATCNITPQ